MTRQTYTVDIGVGGTINDSLFSSGRTETMREVETAPNTGPNRRRAVLLTP